MTKNFLFKLKMDLVPFDLISDKIAKSEFIDFAEEIIYETGTDDKIYTFVDAKGTSFTAIVKYNDKTNQITKPITTQINKKVYNEDENIFTKFLGLDKSIQSFQSYDTSLSKTVQEVEIVSSLQWNIGSTFKDLQALNLMFIRGLITKTPYHLGPLDPESSSISDDLYELNRLGLITINSQPYEKFSANGRLNRQRPYVDFYYNREMIIQLLKELLELMPLLIIGVVDFLTMKRTLYGITGDVSVKNNEYPLGQELVNGIWVDDYNTSFPVDSDNEYNNKFVRYALEELGPNFEHMVQKELAFVSIIHTQFDDLLLKNLIAVAKKHS